MVSGARLTTLLFFAWDLFAPSVSGGSTSATSTSDILDIYTNIGWDICYGEGTICSVVVDFEKECYKEAEAHGNDKYQECLCTSGAKAINEA